MKKRKLIGLLVPASIILTIAIFFFLTIVLPFDMKAYQESISESASETGSAAGGVAVAFGGAFAFIIVLIFSIYCVISSIIAIPLSLGLLKSSVKSFKIIGIVYASLAGLIFTASAIKIISWIVG